MNSQELLLELKQKLATGEISAKELAALIPHTAPQENDSKFSVQKLFYMIGAGIVVLGIALFVGQIWDDLNSVMRVLVTFGVGVIAALSGTILYSRPQGALAGNAFHVIGGILMPWGASILFNELHVETHLDLIAFAVFLLLALFYGMLSYRFHKNTLVFFTLINSTLALFALTHVVLDLRVSLSDIVYTYVSMAIGISYLLVAFASKNTVRAPLIPFLYQAGSILVLLPAIMRTYTKEILVMQILFTLLVGVMLYISSILKSKIILITTMLFLLVHIAHITTKYFSDSLSWPLMLVFLGLVCIALAYVSVFIGRRFSKTI